MTRITASARIALPSARGRQQLVDRAHYVILLLRGEIVVEREHEVLVKGALGVRQCAVSLA